MTSAHKIAIVKSLLKEKQGSTTLSIPPKYLCLTLQPNISNQNVIAPRTQNATSSMLVYIQNNVTTIQLKQLYTAPYNLLRFSQHAQSWRGIKKND